MFKRGILILASVAALMSSCIKEDTSSCLSGVRLKFDYTHNPQSRNLFGTEVTKITVFAFDGDGKYYDTFTDKGPQLQGDYTMVLPLPEGRYTFVAWGGVLNTYWVGEIVDPQNSTFINGLRKGVTTLENFRLLIDGVEGAPAPDIFNTDVNVTDLDDLYYGSVADVESKPGRASEATISLLKTTSIIRVTVTDLDPVVIGRSSDNPHNVDIYCTGRNGRYRWNYAIGDYARPIVYRASAFASTTTTEKADIRVMRIKIENPIMFTVKDKNTNTLLVQKNLISLIMENPLYQTQEAIDREDLFEFNISIKPSGGVEITVNGWVIETVNPG